MKVQNIKQILKNKRNGGGGKAGSAGKTRSGFTLVELIVVLALIGLLLAVSAGGMVGYTMYSTYKRNNDSAKEIFSAAQSAITYYKASGRLDSFRREVGNLGHTPEYVPQEAYADLDTSGEGARTDYSGIDYLMLSKSDYTTIESAVKAGNTKLVNADGSGSLVGPEAKLLYDLLSNYVTNVDIYNASICVEFDARDGVVVGVLYSDKAEEFSYGEGADTMDISRRDSSYRRREGLGYYNTELSRSAPQEEVKDIDVTAARMVNGDSLDVQWFIEKKYQYLKGVQNYKIDLYEDGDSTKLLAEITLDRDDVGFVTQESGMHPWVEARSVLLYSEEGDPYTLKLTSDSGEEKIKFHAYLLQDTSNENYGSGIALSLDVLDSYAAEAMEKDDETELLSTYSARRLSYVDEDNKHYGLSLDGMKKVSAKVSIEAGAGESKTTSSENLFFANGTESGSREFEITNARHLYNAGLFEQAAASETAGAAVTYNITKGFAWGGPDGLLSLTGSERSETKGGEGESGDEGDSDGSAESGEGSGVTTAKYYHRQTAYAYTAAAEGGRTRYPAFPGLDVLNVNSTLTVTVSAGGAEEADSEEEEGDGEDEGDGEKTSSVDPGTIDYLALEPKRNEDGSLGAAGLVRENKGTISGLKLKNVDVRGVVAAAGGSYEAGENTGAFCGANEGTLTDLEVVSGYVTGGKNVGGIFGSTTGTASVSDLKNSAEVSGLENVGGITGALESGMRLDGAENRGIVYGWELPEGAAGITISWPAAGGTVLPEADSKYIGGIAGYVAADAALENCTSNPAPQPGEDGGMAPLTAEEIQARLHGSYVGGIAGYAADGAAISNCGTGAGTDGTGVSSYVLGENFVGGIVGVNAGANLTAGETNKGNSATVIGRRFVGGIVGVNGLVRDGINPDAVEHTDIMVNPGTTLSGWTNSGAVFGASSADGMQTPAYIGGVVGVNAGTVTGCVSTMPEIAGTELFAALGGERADFVGGVAGCNRGSLAAEAGAAVASGAVQGRNYVGGIVGYNDGNNDAGGATITGYTGSTAAVSGNNFVGGAVGLNTSAALLNNISSWNVGTVRGNSYVGGYAGANMISASASVTSANVTIAAAEGEGVTATGAFAGGLFGYNRIIGQTELGTLFDEGTAEGGAAGIVEKMNLAAGDRQVSGDGAGADLSIQVLQVLGMDGPAPAAGEVSMTINGRAVSGPVTAGVFAGGVMGYNAAQTKLTVNNFTGNAAVAATASVAGESMSVAKYGAEKVYSFSGGIIGYVSGSTTLENCSLAENGSVTTPAAATYLGGLAEINEGKINGYSISKAFADANANSHAYVGGIAGVNGYTGEGESRILAEISGSADTGSQGTVAEVSGSSVVGGIAADNYGSIVGCTPASVVSASSAGVSQSVPALGGIAGVNNENAMILLSSFGQNVTLSSQNSAYEGGIAGMNMGTIRKDGDPAGSVEQYAGIAINLTNGSAGTTDTEVPSDGQVPGVSVQAQSAAAQALGGIAGLNSGTIDSINYTGSITNAVSTAKQDASYGGIAGVNAEEGKIELCSLGVNGTLGITTGGIGYVGGAVGRNTGSAMVREIAASEDGTVTINASGAQAIGGIVGANEQNAWVQNTYNGKGWSVTGTAGVVGGIIGLHTSSRPVRGLQNRAAVTLSGSSGSGSSDGTVIIGETGSSAQMNGAAGGIIGRVADGESSGAVLIEECGNIGLVTSEDPAGKAGGILGEWAAHAGGSISGCANGESSEPDKEARNDEGDDEGDTNATIKAAGDASAAGIVGSFTNMGGKVTILSCTNYGVIEDSYGAGIAAVAGVQTQTGDGMVEVSSILEIVNCVNAGGVSGAGAGIAVYDSEKSGAISVELNRCRNYGRSGQDDALFAGLVMNVSDVPFDQGSSALKLKQGQITVENSIGVADVKYPTVPMREGLSDEERKNEFEFVSKLYGADDVYYYSADGVTGPKMIGTAGAGAAVFYGTGAYASPRDESGIWDFLVAANKLDSGTAFDPNGEGYRADYRGNYNRLDEQLTIACLKLEGSGEIDPAKTPSAWNVQADNNGGYLEITWENVDPAVTVSPSEGEGGTDGETTAPDGSDGEPQNTNLGLIYKTVLELRLYEDETSAQEDMQKNETKPTYTATFYGGDVTSHTIPVSDSWIEKWITVTVTNYSYSNTPQDPPGRLAEPFKILRALITPEPVIRLVRFENGQPVYALDLLNKMFYTTPGTVLELSLSVENSSEGEGETTGNEGEGSGGAEGSSFVKTIKIMLDDQPLPYELTAEALDGFSISQPDTDVRLTVQAQAEPGTVGSGGSQKNAPSAKKTMTTIIPAAARLMEGFFEDTTEITGDNERVTFELQGKPATYRAELLWDVPAGDYLLENIVVSSKQLTIENSTGIVQLAIPQDLEGAGEARVYPFNMSGGTTQLGYLVADALTLEGLLEKSETGEYLYFTAAGSVAAAPVSEDDDTQGSVSAQAALEQLAAVGQGTQKMLTSMKAKAGYVIERYGENQYRVFCSPLLTLPDEEGKVVKKQSLRDDEDQQGTEPTSASGTGTKISSTGGSGTSQTETESETEEETEAETEPETEETSETAPPETEPTTESEAPLELLPPETVLLYPNVDQPAGEGSEDIVEGEPVVTPEEYYLQNGLMLIHGYVMNAGSYRMRAAFYTERAAIGAEPDANRMLTLVPGYDGKTEYETDPNIGGYMFQNLPLEYAGKWLCVQLCSVSADGQSRSEWSGYYWFQLPRISLQAPELTRDIVTETDVVTTYVPTTSLDPQTQETVESESESESEIQLQHVAYSWTQTMPKTGEALKAGQSAVGYLIELYRMLNEGVPTDQDEYKNPTTVFSLMRAGGNLGNYYIERDWTTEEIDKWQEENPDKKWESVEPKCKTASFTRITSDSENYEQFKAELEADQNLRLYELTLDENVLGYDDSVTYTEDVSAYQDVLDKSEMKKVYARIRIREHLNSDTREVESIDYQLILPDIEPADGQIFLQTLNGVYNTHSVIVSQLLHSVYDKNTEQQDAFLVPARRQAAYLIKTATKSQTEEGTEELLSYIRLLRPGRNFDEPFDSVKESPEDEPTKYAEYELLPRSYKPQLIRHKGNLEQIAAAMQAALQTDAMPAANTISDEMSFSFDLNGNMVLDVEDETTPGATVPEPDGQDIPSDNGGDWTDGGDIVIGGEEVYVEPQTQAAAEPQTHAAAEQQTQTAAEPVQAWSELPPEDVSAVDPMSLGETNEAA